MKRWEHIVGLYLVSAAIVAHGAGLWWLVATAINTLGAPWLDGDVAAWLAVSAALAILVRSIGDG